MPLLSSIASTGSVRSTRPPDFLTAHDASEEVLSAGSRDRLSRADSPAAAYYLMGSSNSDAPVLGSQWPRDDVLGEEQPRTEPARVGQCRQRRREPHARGEPDRRIEGGRHDGGQPEPFDERERSGDTAGRLDLHDRNVDGVAHERRVRMVAADRLVRGDPNTGARPHLGELVERRTRLLGVLEPACGLLERVEREDRLGHRPGRVRVDAHLSARTGVRAAADEAIRRDHADPTLLRDAVDVAVIKVQPSGGITAALALIGRLGLPAVVSSALDTSVGLAAGVRLAAALPELPYACGLATGLLLAEDVVTGPLRPVGGMLDVAAAGAAAALADPLPSPSRNIAEGLEDRVIRAAAALRQIGQA